MSIADNLLTVANNTPAVAQAVNAAKATITGSSARADDVLDVNHPLEIQTTAGAEVSVYGKNLIDISIIGWNESKSYVQYVAEDNTVLVQGSRTQTTGLSCGYTLQELAPSLEVDKTYIIQGESALSNRGYIYLQGYNRSWMFGNALTMTEQILTSKVLFYTDMGADNVISSLQIELGSTATEYEPYKEPQAAIADESGKVAELMPVSPSMTLVSDHTVECTYFPQAAAEKYAKYQSLKEAETVLVDSIKEEYQ